MTIPNSFELANDSEFRLMANFTAPPRAGRITAIEASGQVRVATDDPDGGDVLAWPLNGFNYAVGDVVYVVFAANSPDTAIVIGAKAPLPTLDATVYSHDHDSDYAAIAHNHDAAYVKQDGTTTLDADWDIGEDRRILTEAVRARDNEGLRLEDSSGNLGARVFDGGGFSTFLNSGKGQVLFESISTSNNCVQLQMTRATATTIVRGLSFRVTMVGRVGTVFTHGLCDVLVQGRNNQSIQYAVVNNNGMTVTAVTQTSTDLTLKFDCGGVSWNELTVGVLAFTPIHASWTIVGSLVA